MFQIEARACGVSIDLDGDAVGERLPLGQWHVNQTLACIGGSLGVLGLGFGFRVSDIGFRM